MCKRLPASYFKRHKRHLPWRCLSKPPLPSEEPHGQSPMLYRPAIRATTRLQSLSLGLPLLVPRGLAWCMETGLCWSTPAWEQGPPHLSMDLFRNSRHDPRPLLGPRFQSNAPNDLLVYHSALHLHDPRNHYVCIFPQDKLSLGI